MGQSLKPGSEPEDALFEAYDIVYDTDGEKVDGLPETVIFDAQDIDEAIEIGADKVSDATGWCVSALNVRKVVG